MALANRFIRFYDKPRNKFLCLLGALIISPVMKGVEKDLKRSEENVEDLTMTLGRLRLTQQLLIRWWK